MDQSPAKSVKNALSPLMNALVMEDLLKHSDVDVNVGVASCISEIIRITAPDDPYDKDKMKVICSIFVLFLYICVSAYMHTYMLPLYSPIDNDPEI